MDKNSAIEMKVEGNSLIIKVNQIKKNKNKSKTINQIADKILKKYKPVFDKLSKT